MDAPNRTIIAYIVGRLITSGAGWWIHDNDRKRNVHLEGTFEKGEIKIYSHELHGHVSGLGAQGQYTLFQHSVGGAVNLLVNAEACTFSGWEHRTGYHFFGNVADRAIRLYDYQDSQWHLYTL
jgi:hypothetical protein